MTVASQNLEALFLDLPKMKEQHAPSHPVYKSLKQAIRHEIEHLFSDHSSTPKNFPPFGTLALPYFKMGAIDSLDLFGLDELIIFSFYWQNRNRYKQVLDIGGNLGLHSIILDKCGYEVKVFEPDPVHFKILKQNLDLNHCQKVRAFNAAVSSRKGEAEFTRVLGNTTSSHLTGSKQPYGELETFTVELSDINELMLSADLIKMDVEGHEKEIILAMEHWENIDAIVEIGSVENAKGVFDHLKRIQVNAFAQKTGWGLVKKLEDMPTSHREGSLFITCRDEMP